MKTPAGTECRYFYGNYYRGRKDEDCRLIGNAKPPHNWTPDLCKTCPVPAILRANACPNMILKGEAQGLILNFMRRVKVTAFCTKSNQVVSEPEIGCSQCHRLPEVFTTKPR
jgi:hypothetical protein